MQNDLIQTITDALSQLIDPNTGKDFVSSKALKKLSIEEGQVNLEVSLGYPAQTQLASLRSLITHAVESVAGVKSVTLNLDWKIVAHSVQAGIKTLPNVRNMIAVASGKGGVGKSTTAVNLALALRAEGAKVGLLDADIYGPSQPLMLGVQGQKHEANEDQTITPILAHGLQMASIGCLIDTEQAVAWRGPMVTGALLQLLQQTAWQDLDYLVIDMPPGTGDIQLTLAQKVPVTGAVIVTTPQEIALLDGRRGVNMFQKVGIPILGVVENMALHVCSQCGHSEPIFGSGGGQRMAEQYGVPYLGALPLDRQIREQTDSGKPTVMADPQSPASLVYGQIARKVAGQIAEKAQDHSLKFPTIKVQAT